MNKHVLLLFILVCYSLPIYYVYYHYNSNPSVSNIICNENCKYIILFFMALMGLGTILYEIERNDIYSIIFICALLTGIYGLIYINETHQVHYVFASLVFLSILCFMIRHCYLTNHAMILLVSFVLEVVMLFYMIVNINTNIFYGEIIYILNFAFFYIYLHFIQPFTVSESKTEVDTTSNTTSVETINDNVTFER